MHILVDISHPAHVHFFRFAIHNWLEAGHTVQITARDKDVTHDLLTQLGLPFRPVGTARLGVTGLALDLLERESIIFSLMLRQRPDVACGIGGTFIAHGAKLLGVPTVVFSDTEHARTANRITFPFATAICTPRSYQDDLGQRQIRYAGYQELAYLHPAYFTPDPDMLEQEKLKPDEPFTFIRQVAWASSHDFDDRGLNDLRLAVSRLQQYGRVLISAEGSLPDDLEALRYRSPVHLVHHFLAHAQLVFGESATMTSESAMLGTPAIFVSTSRRGYTDELEERYDMVFTFDDPATRQSQALAKAEALLSDGHTPARWQEKHATMLADQQDVTQVITDVVLAHAAD